MRIELEARGSRRPSSPAAPLGAIALLLTSLSSCGASGTTDLAPLRCSGERACVDGSTDACCVERSCVGVLLDDGACVSTSVHCVAARVCPVGAADPCCVLTACIGTLDGEGCVPGIERCDSGQDEDCDGVVDEAPCSSEPSKCRYPASCRIDPSQCCLEAGCTGFLGSICQCID